MDAPGRRIRMDNCARSPQNRGVVRHFCSTLLILAAAGAALSGRQAAPERITSFVNPFIGTGGHGHTCPGPSLPFGMIQPGPDTRLTGWDVVLDLEHRDQLIEASIDIVSDTEVAGLRRSTGWARDQVVYFVVRFSRAFTLPGLKGPGLREFAGPERAGLQERLRLRQRGGTARRDHSPEQP